MTICDKVTVAEMLFLTLPLFVFLTLPLLLLGMLLGLLLCLGFPQSSPTFICDNQATISLTKDFQFHAKSKHIDIHVHLIHDKVFDETVSVSYVPSEENVAEIFTKGLSGLDQT